MPQRALTVACDLMGMDYFALDKHEYGFYLEFERGTVRADAVRESLRLILDTVRVPGQHASTTGEFDIVEWTLPVFG